MSCIATFYILPESEYAAFLSARQREPRIEEKRILFFTHRRRIPGEEVWEYLDRVATRRLELDFSGFLLVDYLFVYLPIAGEECFQQIDDHFSALSASGAQKLSAFLATRPVDRKAIEVYLNEDGRPLRDGERDDTLGAYEKAHARVLEWCAMVHGECFGVLHLLY